MTEVYFNPIGGYGFVAGVAAVLLALLWLGPDRARTSLRQRLALSGLRGLVVLLVLLAMLRPAAVVTEIKKQTSTLVLLVDRSRSMQVTDALGGKSRWETLRGVLGDSASLLGRLKDVVIKVYEFDSELHPLEAPAGVITLESLPTGEQTAIGAALEEILRKESGQRLLGIVLLGDGAQRAYAPFDTPPQVAARRLADLGVPLYTFTFGQSRGVGQARDVALRDLLASPTVFVKNQFEVNGSVRVDGYQNQKIPVQLLFENAAGEMEVVATEELQVTAGGRLLPVHLSYVPQVPGEYKVTLRVAPQDGELVTTNNELSTFVAVRKGGIQVLYLEGALRVEQRFVRASIDASPDIKLDFERIDDRNRKQWPLSIGDRFAPGKYDVFVIGDLDAGAVKNEDWKKLADRVDHGAGQMFLGGFHSYGPGGYHNTPLASVLPITIEKYERQKFAEPISKDLHLPGPLKMVPAKPLGLGHPIMQLGPPADNRRIWDKLPPLDGANLWRGLKPGAVVLAESVNAPPRPLLVASSWGDGRVLAFAGDSTWRWCLEGFEKEHRRLWRQIVLWLAKKEESTDGNVWVKLDARRFMPSARVAFSVGAIDPTGAPVEGAKFQGEVVLPGGEKRSVQLTRQGETVVGTFLDTQKPGDYAITVIASVDGAPIGSVRTRFLVLAQDLELDNPAADPGLLASLARMTDAAGGKSLAPEELPALIKQLQEQPAEHKVETQVKHTYWDTWPFLLAFVTVIGTEWYLRKKWGLV